MKHTTLFICIYVSAVVLPFIIAICYANRYWFIRNFTKTIQFTVLEPEKLIIGQVYIFGVGDNESALYVGKNKFKLLKTK